MVIIDRVMIIIEINFGKIRACGGGWERVEFGCSF